MYGSVQPYTYTHRSVLLDNRTCDTHSATHTHAQAHYLIHSYMHVHAQASTPANPGLSGTH